MTMIATSSGTAHLVKGLCIGAGIALLGCGMPEAESSKDAGSSPLVGTPAPAISAEKITGEGPTNLKDASGKVVILDFWGTYCDPCKKSFPKYQELTAQLGDSLTVIAV